MVSGEEAQQVISNRESPPRCLIWPYVFYTESASAHLRKCYNACNVQVLQACGPFWVIKAEMWQTALCPCMIPGKTSLPRCRGSFLECASVCSLSRPEQLFRERCWNFCVDRRQCWRKRFASHTNSPQVSAEAHTLAWKEDRAKSRRRR